MRLLSFKVTNFRSVDDSGQIETDDVTALIGVNESGKSNLLLPLWKLNPAKDGEIKPTADYPRKSYTDFRNMEKKPVFIDCLFEADDETKNELSRLTGTPADLFKTIRVRREYGGTYYITFPQASGARTIEANRVRESITAAQKEISSLTPLKIEEDYAASIKGSVTDSLNAIGGGSSLGVSELEKIFSLLPVREPAAKTSSIAPRYGQLREELQEYLNLVQKPLPGDVKEARQYALKRVPPLRVLHKLREPRL
jgi:hypothetical protein